MIQGPLAGVRVVVTRARDQAQGLVALLEAEGAAPALLPLLEMADPIDPEPLLGAVRDIASFQWLVLTSANAVDAFFSRCPSSLPSGLEIASIGPATTRALRARGVKTVVEAERSLAEGLLEVLEGRLEKGERILLPQAEDARPVLARGLESAGARVTAVASYRKVIPADAASLAQALFAGGPAGWITFTSPSTAHNLREVLARNWDRERPGILAASVGPITSAALRELGLEPAAEAARPGDQGLVEAIVGVVMRKGGSRRN